MGDACKPNEGTFRIAVIRCLLLWMVVSFSPIGDAAPPDQSGGSPHVDLALDQPRSRSFEQQIDWYALQQYATPHASVQQVSSEALLKDALKSPPSASKKSASNTGFLDFNLYPYTLVDSDNSLTINALANLPHGLQYFSLSNFGRDRTRGELEETVSLLTEQNLRWTPDWNLPLAAAAQVLLRTSDDNDVLRFGPRWAAHQTPLLDSPLQNFGIKYWVAFYAAQFDHAEGAQWQIEHVFLWKVFPELLDDRVYISGFADHNINHHGATSSTWVEETQLGVRVVDEWYLVAEQRYNGFRVGDESSLGLGIEYVIRFK
ncbi:hypothetical protein K227x_57110 [Rubripirellula lacrimiformis]|uniref:Uncharacterized protein n=1 Tax=Rubripirellula lacrimiformis TaxID=1930273 RepID=A0A517NJH2_9BACT|nr:hypothetical protein [Rubripirellula lacrimiformis]QDT07284.1 hypothetical protein K227x_57110 [Rubripirellula lacrimiformis]